MRLLLGCLTATMVVFFTAGVLAQELEEAPPVDVPEATDGAVSAPEDDATGAEDRNTEAESTPEEPEGSASDSLDEAAPAAEESAAGGVGEEAGAEAPGEVEPEAAPVQADEPMGAPMPAEPATELESQPTAAAPSESEADTELERQGGEQVWTNALPFRGTRLVYENVFNLFQLTRNDDQTYNPYYAMSLSIQPRWYFMDELSLRLRFDIEGELTDADDTSDYHETRVSDLTLDLVYNPIVRIPGIGIDVGAGLRMQFPTSLQSQAETRYLGIGPSLNLTRVFDVLDGLLVSYGFRYMKYLNRYTTLERDTNPYASFCSPNQPDCLAHHQLGDMAVSHSFYNTLMLGLDFLTEQWRQMSFAFMVVFINSLAYEAPEATVDINENLTVPVDHIEDPQNHRAAIWYVFELSLMITDYLSLSIGTSTLSPQLAPDSTYREPIFNRYTNVYVDLSLDIERLVAAVRR